MSDRLVSAEALRKRMYHEAFETDTDMQKWDSGCWIRYKMFENAIEDAPTVDAVEVVRCKDCIHYWKNKPSDDIPVCLASPKDDAYCSEGERREDGNNDRN